jgi:hypothetical protein
VWVKIDDKLHENAKIQAASGEAVKLYVIALSYANDKITDGYIASWLLPRLTRLRRPEATIKELVAAKLLHLSARPVAHASSNALRKACATPSRWAATCGAERLVCARVIESRDELDRYRAAIPGAAITVARLRASHETLETRLSHRLARRDLVDGQDHQEDRARRERRALRSRELAEVMDRQALEDILVSTDGRGVGAVARDVLVGAGWPGA